MRRSPSSSCSSSTSSGVGSETTAHRSQNLPKPKRARKIQSDADKQPQKNADANTTTNGSSRRSSIYRGVTRHRWTGRFEAHLWDKSSWNNIQNKKGRQVYLGAYDNEVAAARTYDLAALKYWGPHTTLNFPAENYEKEVAEMEKVTKEEFLATLRRQSSGFSRGVSKYRGVARHHHNGRWEARIGRVLGSKYLYLGTYNTQEEAAAAYDMAAIEYRGANAVTNFDISRYIDRLNVKIFPPAKTQKREEEEGEEEEEEGEVEQQVKQEEEKEEKRRESKLSEEKNSAMGLGMNPVEDEDIGSLEWCFLDSGFSLFPVPDLPLENPSELPDLFGDVGFEENIDLIFDGGYGGSDCCGEEVGGSGRAEESGEEKRRRLPASPSPSSSTITSVGGFL